MKSRTFIVCLLSEVLYTLYSGTVSPVTASVCTQSQSSPTTISLSDKTEGREQGCVNLNESRWTCSDLQSAINWIVESSVYSARECIEIRLPDGDHTITGQTDLKNASVHLVGLGDYVTVQCTYIADTNLNESREIHTWYFDHSDSVAFNNIHFRSCGFPFRFDTIRNVYLNNCTFR